MRRHVSLTSLVVLNDLTIADGGDGRPGRCGRSGRWLGCHARMRDWWHLTVVRHSRCINGSGDSTGCLYYWRWNGWLIMMTLRRCRWRGRLRVSCHVAGKRQVMRCTLSMTHGHTEIWGCRDVLSTRGMMAHTPLGWLITSCLVDPLIFIVLWCLMSRRQIIILLPILPIIGRKI